MPATPETRDPHDADDPTSEEISARGIARRIARLREIADGDNLYEVVATRAALQLLFGEIDKLTEALAADEIFQMMTEDGLTGELLAGPCHRTLAGAAEALTQRAKKQGGNLIPPAPDGDRPWATRCGANRSTVWIENRKLEG